MAQKPKVVVLGGGYGGVRAALDLAQEKVAEVVLIDKKPFHSLPPQFYEVASLFYSETAGRNMRSTFDMFFHSAVIPFETLFGSRDNVEVVVGEVEMVLPRESRVVMSGQSMGVAYDWLIVALGSKTNFFDIPHLENNSIGFKSVEEALNIRDAIDELFLKAPKHKKITIVIGGGGVTGCEVAAELVGYMNSLSKIHKRPIGGWSCVILEGGASVLGASPQWIQKKATERLMKLGITVLTGSSIVDVWPGTVFIGKERKPFLYDLLLWTAGVKGACTGDLIKDVTLEKRNCLGVDELLRVSPYKNIFSIGDVALSFDKKTKLPLAMTAQKAIHEGHYVAHTVSALIRNPGVAPKEYQPKESSYIIPLGGKYALLDTRLIKGAGLWVWFLRYGALLRYLFSILPPHRALVYWAREIVLFTRNDKAQKYSLKS